MSVLTIFDHPAKQSALLKDQMREHLEDKVFYAVVAYCSRLSENKKTELNNIFLKRQQQVESLFEEEVETREAFFQHMQRFINITGAAFWNKELKQVLDVSILEENYRSVFNAMEQGPFGEVYQRYEFAPETINGISQSLLKDSTEFFEALKEYDQKLGKHIQVMKSSSERTGEKTFFKTVSRIAGSFVLPFIGSRIAGHFADSLVDNHRGLLESYEQAYEAWTAFCHNVDQFSEKFTERYEHALLTLIGGTIMRVNQDLSQMHVFISYINLHKRDVEYSFTPKEQERFRTWMQRTTIGISNLVEKGDFDKAHAAGYSLKEFILSNPLLEDKKYRGGVSYLEEASFWYYAVTASRMMNHQENRSLSLALAKELLEGLPVKPDAKQISKHKLVPLHKVVLLGLHQAINTNQVSSYVNSVKKFHNRNSGRTDFINFKQLADVIYLILTFERGISGKQGNNTDTDISIGSLKKTRKDYRLMTGVDKDAFTDLIKDLILARRTEKIKNIVFNKKTLLAAAVFILSLALYTNFEKLQTAYQMNKESREMQALSNDASIEYFIISEEYANIRSNPILEGDVAGIASKDNRFRIKAKKTDLDGRTWYHIETREGVSGWVSEKTGVIE
ncbi:SH3 domain-containing protein [Jeotgalibacillus salarius]|uniref:SH3 domain-containing protein n=1 Tax=Jeotgalibacillus salarius TaxID=546023 RepID=A0A4Y8LLY7_9BACL|nr:SH3 domain-containing protein [Jeotgalibacillus salarius]TFE04048.1 SH3 domain-containing protein [Jeotgalibacillus salarius]